MKNVIALMFVLSFAYAQTVSHSTFTPKTLFDGTDMSARTASTSMDDTTRAFACRGYQAVYVGLESATNDTVHAYVSYQVSKDGVTYGALAVVDSLSVSGTVGVATYIPLPATALVIS